MQLQVVVVIACRSGGAKSWERWAPPWVEGVADPVILLSLAEFGISRSKTIVSNIRSNYYLLTSVDVVL